MKLHPKPLPVVITSIQAPTPSVAAMVEAGHHVTVLGDRKSPPPEAYARTGITYFSLEAQRGLGGELLGLLPESSYARKNLGYLRMAAAGETAFLETDDDNAPLPGWQASLTELAAVVRRPRAAEAGSGNGLRAVNVYGYFGQGEVWPRGFPLRRIRDLPPACEETTLGAEPWIVQGLANGEPDVDAIFRLVHPGRSTTFAPGAPVLLGPGDWCPFNSQNTLWRRPAYPLAYLPFTVPMRFTDILRGYVAQACVRAAGGALAFAEASVWQERNPHDALRDFAGEIDFYLRAEEIMERLCKLELRGQPGADLIACYEELLAMQVVEAAELNGVRAFLRDLAAGGGWSA